MPKLLSLLIVAVLLGGIAGCGSQPAAALPPTTTAPPAASMPFRLTSSAFENDQVIPDRHSCAGEDRSPPLSWSAAPGATQSLVLIMDDPDAVPVVGFVYDHWLLFNLPPDTVALPEGLPRGGELPDGSRQGRNSSGQLGYGGPCPPGGQTHGYVFTLYAVDTTLTLEAGATKAAILEAIDGHILAQSQLVGQFTAR